MNKKEEGGFQIDHLVVLVVSSRYWKLQFLKQRGSQTKIIAQLGVSVDLVVSGVKNDSPPSFQTPIHSALQVASSNDDLNLGGTGWQGLLLVRLLCHVSH